MQWTVLQSSKWKWNVNYWLLLYGDWLCDLRCNWVDTARMGSTSDLLVCSDPAVRYVVAAVAIEVRALWCHLYADRFLHSMVWLACCSILVSSQQRRWSSVHVYLAMVDLSVKPLMQASLCSFRHVSSWHFVCRAQYLFSRVPTIMTVNDEKWQVKPHAC